MNHFPRKSRTRKFERTAAPEDDRLRGEREDERVADRRKFSSCHAFVKLSKPTQSPVSDPPIAFVKLR